MPGKRSKRTQARSGRRNGQNKGRPRQGVPAATPLKGPGPQRPSVLNGQLYQTRSTPLFPPTYRQPSMTYYDVSQQLSVSAGFAGTRFFIANGLFDPDISGTGHQPMGFDQMMGVYTTYHVMRSTITVTGIPEVNGCALGIYLSPDTTSITDPIRLVENGLMRLIHLGPSAGENNRMNSVSLSCDVPAYFGRTRGRNILNDDNLGGTLAANPFEGVYFGVVAFCFYSAAAVVVDYDVLLTYDAVFSEPRKLTVS